MNTSDYSGDGTIENEIISVAGAYEFEGTYDPEDPAQELIASIKYRVGEERKVWHKVISADGKKEWMERATVSDIVAGSGNAGEYEAFGCNIRFDKLPQEKNLDDGGDEPGK